MISKLTSKTLYTHMPKKTFPQIEQKAFLGGKFVYTKWKMMFGQVNWPKFSNLYTKITETVKPQMFSIKQYPIKSLQNTNYYMLDFKTMQYAIDATAESSKKPLNTYS